MLEKKTNKITVTELTELADVNRSTFYLYYKDIYDMIEKIENEMLSEFMKAIQDKAITEGGYDNVLSFMIFVFEFVRENADMCQILFSHDGDNAFLNKFKDAILEAQPPVMNHLTGIESRYFMPFAISGCIGAIQQWFEDDMNVPPEEIAVFVIELITKGVKSLSIQTPDFSS
jgi:hypothetical protein